MCLVSVSSPSVTVCPAFTVWVYASPRLIDRKPPADTSSGCLIKHRPHFGLFLLSSTQPQRVKKTPLDPFHDSIWPLKATSTKSRKCWAWQKTHDRTTPVVSIFNSQNNNKPLKIIFGLCAIFLKGNWNGTLQFGNWVCILLIHASAALFEGTKWLQNMF